MRKLGIITNIENDSISLDIWDQSNNKIKEINPSQFQDKPFDYFIGQIVQYLEETNQIIPLTNVNYTAEEQEELLKVFKEAIRKPKVYLALYEQIDMLEGKVPIKNTHR